MNEQHTGKLDLTGWPLPDDPPPLLALRNGVQAGCAMLLLLLVVGSLRQWSGMFMPVSLTGVVLWFVFLQGAPTVGFGLLRPLRHLVGGDRGRTELEQPEIRGEDQDPIVLPGWRPENRPEHRCRERDHCQGNAQGPA